MNDINYNPSGENTNKAKSVKLLDEFYFASVHDKIISLTISQDTRKKYNKKYFDGNDEKAVLLDSEFEEFIEQSMIDISEIATEVSDKIGVEFEKPKLIFLKDNIARIENDGPLSYLPYKNIIYIGKTTIKIFNNSKTLLIGAMAHEIGHSIQKQVNIIDILSDKEKENHADLIAGYILNKLGVDKEGLYNFGFFMANIGDKLKVDDLIMGFDNIHGDGRIRKKYIYKGYYSEMKDIILGLDKKILITKYLKKKAVNIMNILDK